ncbi:MAG TPA: J domain-containing protein [Ilumatobacteraceae bacterium]
MLLAEVVVWHTRPAVPTRRIALGHLVLPVDPPPGFGGLLLGAVVAAHVKGIDDELLPDVNRLIDQVQRGERVVQPRLRHRYQIDRHGLAHSSHRLLGEDDDIRFELNSAGTDLAQVLGAIYATERLDLESRRVVAPVLHRATQWRGPIDRLLVEYLAGTQAMTLAALADPRAWALDVLGFPPGTDLPSKRDVTAHYRARMRAVHPDHGGDGLAASTAIRELNEARRILSARVA